MKPACQAYVSDYTLAKAIGVNRSTVSRIIRGTMEPGENSIAGVVAVFAKFDRYFDVETLTGRTKGISTRLPR